MLKLSNTQKAHLPSFATKNEDALEDFLSYFDTARMTRGVLKLSSSDDDYVVYYFRGHEITQNESVPNGYYGRWRVGQHGDDTLENCKVFITNKINQG